MAIMGWGAIMTLSSCYVLQGEVNVKARSLLKRKLLAASFITLLFAVSMLVGSIVYLIQYKRGG